MEFWDLWIRLRLSAWEEASGLWQAITQMDHWTLQSSLLQVFLEKYFTLNRKKNQDRCSSVYPLTTDFSVLCEKVFSFTHSTLKALGVSGQETLSLLNERTQSWINTQMCAYAQRNCESICSPEQFVYFKLNSQVCVKNSLNDSRQQELEVY